ncbi:hypothetical protein E2562_035166 [Oryza meyeriana var. granulata]|uniref:Uncharacterized protein n=1 Tax=Oryza meyeriana var. granulata TaxID=110450 RepID=A0A6G1E5S2_9ORYZ|nr:hypothetical protein E2562_035166 [Oryza meyeriana var. granulata]
MPSASSPADGAPDLGVSPGGRRAHLQGICDIIGRAQLGQLKKLTILLLQSNQLIVVFPASLRDLLELTRFI